MDKKEMPAAGIGVASILTVLLVLTLSVFAALTLASARADLALSKINADTVSDYYAADREAARLYREFAAGAEASLQADIPMDRGMTLHIHLVREDAEVRILAWQVIAQEQEGIEFLPVWDGELPE